MPHYDKPVLPGDLDKARTGANRPAGVNADTPCRAARPKTKSPLSFAAFLLTIPPGDAFDAQDFARIQ